MNKPKIQSAHMAAVTKEICKNLYYEGGADKVYDYCNKIKRNYDHCKPCDAETPTITRRSPRVPTILMHECAVCGSNKEL